MSESIGVQRKGKYGDVVIRSEKDDKEHQIEISEWQANELATLLNVKGYGRRELMNSEIERKCVSLGMIYVPPHYRKGKYVKGYCRKNEATPDVYDSFGRRMK